MQATNWALNIDHLLVVCENSVLSHPPVAEAAEVSGAVSYSADSLQLEQPQIPQSYL
jgi:hypothetical protein